MSLQYLNGQMEYVSQFSIFPPISFYMEVWNTWPYVLYLLDCTSCPHKTTECDHAAVRQCRKTMPGFCLVISLHFAPEQLPSWRNRSKLVVRTEKWQLFVWRWQRAWAVYFLFFFKLSKNGVSPKLKYGDIELIKCAYLLGNSKKFVIISFVI
jgi:hypothetical protein